MAASGVRVRSRTQLEQLNRFNPLADVTNILNFMGESGCILQGHFALGNGRHSQYFLRFSALQFHRSFLPTVAGNLLTDPGLELDTLSNKAAILTPESSGFLLADCVHQLLREDRGHRQLRLAVTKVDLQRRPINEMRRGNLRDIEEVIIVNDVATSGRSLRTLETLAISHGATIRAILLMASLSPNQLSWALASNPYCVALVYPTWPIYSADMCPMCAQGDLDIIPATELN